MPQTIDHVYFDEEFMATDGVRDGLMEGADRSKANYYIEDNLDGTESVFYFTEGGSPFYLGDRENTANIGGIAGISPEGLPMEAPAGSQSVTPTEFITDIANFVKGVGTGAVGLPGDLVAIANGLYEIGSRGGDAGYVSAFLDGIAKKTFLPTTEDVNKWIDTNIPLPQRMKTSKPEGVPDVMVRGVVDPQAEGPISKEGTAAPYIGSVTSTLGEIVSPATVVAQSVKAASKLKSAAKPLAATAATATMDKGQKAK